MDLQRLQDEMDLTKLNYDTLARNDRSTKDRVEAMTTKVDSVEKKIEAIGVETSTRFEALEKKMTAITELLTRFEETAVIRQRQGKEIASSSEPQIPQVLITISEPELPLTQLGYRRIHDTIANRDKMLRKIEMHVFSGPLPFDWISRVERFFRFGNYNEEERLHLVSLSLEGPVLQWFNGEVISDPFVSWEQFTQRMLDRFGGPIDNDPAARLFCLHQEGDIVDYVNEFESLRNQVTGIDENNLIKVFFNGLKPEMKEVIRLKEPVSLTDHKLAVLKMQSTTFCKVIGSAGGNNQRYASGVRSSGFPQKQQSESLKSDAASNKENTRPHGSTVRSRQQYLDVELDRTRKDKFCFRCKASWSPAHKDV